MHIVTISILLPLGEAVAIGELILAVGRSIKPVYFHACRVTSGVE
jgi:hypothetical protein